MESEPQHGAADTQLLFGVPVHPVTRSEAVARCVAAVEQDQRLSVGVVNAAKLVTLQSDEPLRAAVVDCDLILADGQAVVWASKILGRPLPERVAGIDLFLDLLAAAEARGDRVYFLGATPAVLERAVAGALERHPKLRIAGSHHGYFHDVEAEAVARRIHNAQAQLLFVGMTSPKKETFLHRFQNVLGVNITHGVGGSFDILAGSTRRAPAGWQRLGFEWLYRVLQEPRRLARRYLVTNSRFILMTFREARRR